MVETNINIISREVKGNTYYDYIISYTPYSTMIGVVSNFEKTLNKIKEAILDMDEPTKKILRPLEYNVL